MIIILNLGHGLEGSSEQMVGRGGGYNARLNESHVVSAGHCLIAVLLSFTFIYWNFFNEI